MPWRFRCGFEVPCHGDFAADLRCCTPAISLRPSYERVTRRRRVPDFGEILLVGAVSDEELADLAAALAPPTDLDALSVQQLGETTQRRHRRRHLVVRQARHAALCNRRRHDVSDSLRRETPSTVENFVFL